MIYMESQNMKLKKSWKDRFPEILIILFKIISKKSHYSIRYNNDYIPVFRYGKGLNILNKSISNLFVCEAGIMSFEFERNNKKISTITSCNWSGLIGQNAHTQTPKKVIKGSIQYLIENYKENESKNYIWLKNNRQSPYNHKSGWKSAHTQIAFIQLLLRAYKLEQKPHYITLINKALSGFYIPVEDGGLTNMISDNSWWYMKFAEVSSKELRILNSMLFIMIGFYELNEIEDLIDSKHKLLIEKGEHALLNQLHLFDSGKWSYYDNMGLSSGDHYHQKHIELLDKMFELTKNNTYKNFASKFKDYVFQKETT